MSKLFPTLHGNEASKKRIARALQGGRLPHAFLIDGPEGSGKLTYARLISAAANCTDKSADLPCGVCNNCRRILADGFVDVKILSRTSDKATLGVSEVKEFREDVYLSPTESEYKIYIICDAEKLTPEAQNSLLIVLEDPPPGVILMLLACGTDKILTTIKSRAQYVSMSRFSDSEIKEYLLANEQAAKAMQRSDPEGFELLVLNACGIIGRAKALLDPKNSREMREDHDMLADILDAMSPKVNYATLYKRITMLPTKRDELARALEGLMSGLRDMIVERNGGTAPLLFYSDRQRARALGRDIGKRRLASYFDIVNKAHAENYKNANITALLVNLAAGIKLC